MGNSLNKNLRMGDVVVAKKESVIEEYYNDLRMVIRVETFGASSFTSGSKLGVSWIGDKTEDVWDGYLLDKDASEKAQKEIKDDPQYGWLFRIIENMQKERERQDRVIAELRRKLEHPRTRVVAIYTDLCSEDSKFKVTVYRTDGSVRIYHVSRSMHLWLLSATTFGFIQSSLTPNPISGYRLYP